MTKWYFIAANAWGMLGVITVIGMHTERFVPTRYSFFGFGHWFSASEYGLLVALLFCIAAAFGVLAWRDRDKR
ncbi:MAG: hypothetical protein EOP84_36720 [Verrucomicrobiaceae bacterium]|nr:MAG: hypothetical protein EOP84_36720 [Verrucomicrobiaceae bacterium]